MKLEKLRHIFKGRGRNLKCEEFPDLAGILEYAFGKGNRIDRAGGGLESHPRLQSNRMFFCKQYCNIAMQCCNIDVQVARSKLQSL